MPTFQIILMIRGVQTMPKKKADIAHFMPHKKNITAAPTNGIKGIQPQRYIPKNTSAGRIHSYFGLPIPAKMNLKRKSLLVTNLYTQIQRTKYIIHLLNLYAGKIIASFSYFVRHNLTEIHDEAMPNQSGASTY